MSFQVSGLGSGFDFTTLINQLMQLERQPYVRIQAQIAKQQKSVDAIASVQSKLSAVSTAAQKLSTATNFFQMKATSSDESAVVATVSNNSVGGSLSFNVDQLAQSASSVSANSVASLSTTIATGNFSLNGTTISVGDGTLQSVVNSINQTPAAGVRASAVKVGANAYKLQLTASATGASSQVNVVDGGNLASLGGFNVTQAAQDAILTIGSGLGAYQVTSNTNTVRDLLPGITITAKKVTAAPVTVDTTFDGKAIGDSIADMVTAANAAIDEIKTHTKISSSTSATGAASTSAGPLTGNFAVQTLASNITNSVISAISGTTYGSAGNVGVSITSDGHLKFDRAKFDSAFNADPTGVGKMFTAGASFTDSRATFVAAGQKTPAGTYAISVSQAGTQAQTTGYIGTVTFATSQNITVEYNGTTVGHAINAGETLAQARDGLNQALANGGIVGVTASLAGGGLMISTNNYGTGETFKAKFATPDPLVTYTGTDIVGTLNGETATGNGQTLSIANPNSALFGLAVNVAATPAQIAGPTSIGSLTYAPGIAQRLISTINFANDSISGTLTLAANSFKNLISAENKDLIRMDARLVLKQAQLKAQYAKLDTTLGTLQNQSSSLASAIASLNPASR